MKERFWKTFVQTGKVEDYLNYKGMEICRNVMEKYEKERKEHGAENRCVSKYESEK